MSAKCFSFFCIVVFLFTVAFAIPAPKAEAPKENMKTAETIYDWSPFVMYYSDPDYVPFGYRTVLPLEYYNSVYPSWLYKK